MVVDVVDVIADQSVFVLHNFTAS